MPTARAGAYRPSDLEIEWLIHINKKAESWPWIFIPKSNTLRFEIQKITKLRDWAYQNRTTRRSLFVFLQLLLEHARDLE